MSDATRRGVLLWLGVGVLLCALAIMYQVGWWSSAWWAFADEVQSGRVQPDNAVEESRGFIGHRPQYVLCWTVIAAALGLAAVAASIPKRRTDGAN